MEELQRGKGAQHVEHLFDHFRDAMSHGTSDTVPVPTLTPHLVEGAGVHSAISGFAVSQLVGSVCAAGMDEEVETRSELIRMVDEDSQSRDSGDDRTSVDNLHSRIVKSAGSGGFVVEEAYGPSPLHSCGQPPPVYTPPSRPPGSSSPYSYTSVSHKSKPPPSFAEAIATTPPLSAVPVELSPLAAHYVPPMPAVQQDPILVRNEHGVFLLQPITKPTPPYTPPSAASPMTPLTRYTLPPAAQQPCVGSSLAPACEERATGKIMHDMYSPPLHPNTRLSGSHVLSSGKGAGAYTYMSTSFKSGAVAGQVPPPPYPS
ncbi:hypothetical protein ERJ75_001319200 [Trypanosoma vivax]|nr:hypothetical protein TRVL_10065 [Trypanosoma vivax]KAH8608248.1 hypothetical protein ERJ75_001319200 [Trypanosoma vivax]